MGSQIAWSGSCCHCDKAVVYQAIQSITQSTGYSMHYLLFCPIPFQHLKHTKGSENNTSTSPVFALSEHSLCFSATCLSSKSQNTKTIKAYLSGLCYALIADGHPDPLNSTSTPGLNMYSKE